MSTATPTPNHPVSVGSPSPTAASPATTALTHRQILEVMTGLLAALFTALLSTTIVATALPTIMSDLHGTQRQYTWVITSALLAMTVTTPIWGKLSDLFSKKLLVQLSIVLFVAGSIGAGLSQSVPPMMAFRAVQGVAMGGLTALVQSIMGSVIPPRQRGRYTGYMGAVMAVSTVSGPLLGGVLTDSIGWRWCFFVCVPLAVISMVLLQITLHLPVRRRRVKIDYLGAVLIAFVAALPMLWVTFAGRDYAWVSWQSGLFLAGFVVAVVLAVLTELRSAEPMVPVRLLRNRTTVLMILAGVGVGVALFGSSTFLTQYFQLAGGNTPTRAGLMTIPLIVAQMASSVVIGQIVSRTGRWKLPMVIGAFMMVIGLGLMGTLDHTTPYWQIAIFVAVLGVGVGALVQNIVLAVQNTVDVSQVGATSAAVSFFRSLGGAVGVSVLGAVLANHVMDHVQNGLRAAGIKPGAQSGGSLDLNDLPAPIRLIVRTAYGDSFGTLFLIAAGVALLTLVTVLAVREVPLRNTVEMTRTAEATPTAAASGYAEAIADTGLEDGKADVTNRSAEVRGQGQPAQVADASVPVDASAPADDSVSAKAPASGEVHALDDPAGRKALAALDVLRAAQDQARSHVAASTRTQTELVGLVDALQRRIDTAMTEFDDQLVAIRARLDQDKPVTGLGVDGDGGDSLRSYEYGLLLNSQQTADKVTQVARIEAERVLTEADGRVDELERRIATLRQVEAELAAKVADTVRVQV